MWKKFKIFFYILPVIVVGNFYFSAKAQAVVGDYFIHLDAPTINRGYTVSPFGGKLKLSLVPGILSESTAVLAEEIEDEMSTPWNLEKISPIYQFEFANKTAYDNHKPFYIQFSYDKQTLAYKQVYFFDKNYNGWRPLPTIDFPEEGFVRSLIHLPFARIAVFADAEKMSHGKASWYGYEGGDFAASPDFPKGSKLRVYNLDNDKFVDVEVNDYGPDRKIHPDRVIDLDKVAFAKLADLGEGIIDVKVEPIYVAPSKADVLGVSAQFASNDISVAAKSAIIMDGETGEIIFEKNSGDKLALASLTKLVAIKVFLDIEDNLNREGIYLYADEEYNYDYCAKWESARVRLNEGDVVTINDLLYSSLVGSANNAIETLVRLSGVGRDEFIKKMNDYASQIGARATYFEEPTGLSPRNRSTAYDYALLVKDIFKNPLIGKISSADAYTFETVNTKISHTLRNTDRLVKKPHLGIVGSKTGYLHEAGYCLTVKTSQNGRELITVLMGADNRDLSFYETEKMIKYGFDYLNS